ncbi:hypothetical protein TNCV_3167831 [Trichonephila clavipes]|uniref:Uncharacterized protein n=1 Tax=Trichonephila clavipes TaxID=2585209 RepID=A0A8X6RE91_TRICX|nr:hypothetical protein TNCV_3167831 [Trichonephila clavipes]
MGPASKCLRGPFWHHLTFTISLLTHFGDLEALGPHITVVATILYLVSIGEIHSLTFSTKSGLDFCGTNVSMDLRTNSVKKGCVCALSRALHVPVRSPV